jgi:hypothetical protein
MLTQPICNMNLPPAARPILERMAYFFYLALLVCSIGITWLGWMVGCITGDYTAMLCALAGLLCSRWLHVHGHAHWHFHECQAALDSVQAAESWPRSKEVEQLSSEVAGLFTKMDVEPDVWTRGELRREIATRLAAAPALREEFAEKLAEHPEL